MLSIEDLVVKYRRHIALDKINLLIKKGENVAIAGQNGAGKSSLLKSIIGEVVPSSGRISNSGNIGWMPEAGIPYPKFKVTEFLEYIAYLKGFNLEQSRKLSAKAIKMCELVDKRDVLCSTLSKGLSRRVLLASAILGDPDLLILDEPSSGLDPLFQKKMIELIKKVTIGKTLLISTHNIKEIEELADRVIVLKMGKVSFNGGRDNNLKWSSCYEYF